MIKPAKYIRKPLIVEAIQVTEENFLEVARWCVGAICLIDGDITLQMIDPDDDMMKFYIRVRVYNPKTPRQTKAHVGDWILYTVQGYKIYTNRAFFKSFDLVDETTAS